MRKFTMQAPELIGLLRCLTPLMVYVKTYLEIIIMNKFWKNNMYHFIKLYTAFEI